MQHLSESVNLGARGSIVLSIGGSVIRRQSNLVVDMSVEVMMQALLGRDVIDTVVFGDSGGASVTPGLRSVYNPVFKAAAGASSSIQPTITRDSQGFGSIGTWTAIYPNMTPGAITCDMLGLVAQSGKLFAATTFPTASIGVGESVVVEWTINLAGR